MNRPGDIETDRPFLPGASPIGQCPACASRDIALIGLLPRTRLFAGIEVSREFETGSLVRCRNCRLKFRTPLLSSDEYTALYDNGQEATWQDGAERIDWDQILAYLHRRPSPPARLLDIGCYTGGLLARVGQQTERFGIEINHAAARIARTKANATVYSRLDDIPPSVRFDVIVAADVIEHLPNPADFILDATRLLTPDGVLLLSTGDADAERFNRAGANWWYCFYPEHISFISQAWLDWFCRSQSGRYEIEFFDRFRYKRLTTRQRLTGEIGASLFAFSPQRYVGVSSWFRRALGRDSFKGPAGWGLSSDHLLVGLRKRH